MLKNNQTGIAPLAVAIVVVIVILVGGGIYLSQKQKIAQPAEEEAGEEDSMTKDHEMSSESMDKDDMMMKEEDKMMSDSGMKNHGLYKNYSVQTLASEQAAGQKVVLYFHAAWCPECRAADADFKANANKIPAGVTLLKLDYDEEKELKQKYGVTYQHTFVQIDNQGNLVTKWISGDTDLLIKNIK